MLDEKRIKDNIRNIRKQLGLTQYFMASQLGINTVSYQRLENGNTRLTINYLNDLSTVFNMPVYDIIYFHEIAIGNTHHLAVNDLKPQSLDLNSCNEDIKLINKQLDIIKDAIIAIQLTLKS